MDHIITYPRCKTPAQVVGPVIFCKKCANIVKKYAYKKK